VVAVKQRELAGRQKELFHFIRKNPGTHLRELQRRLSVSSMGNLEYHIVTLQKLKLVVEKTEGGYKRYYPVHGAVANKELLSFLRQKIPRRIAILILESMRRQGHFSIEGGEEDEGKSESGGDVERTKSEEGKKKPPDDPGKAGEEQAPSDCGMTPFELMGELGLSPSALSYYLSKMRKKGVLRKEKQGKNVFYIVEKPEEVLKLIISYREGFMDGLVDSFMDAWGL